MSLEQIEVVKARNVRFLPKPHSRCVYRLLLILILFPTAKAMPQARYQVGIDATRSSQIGAENLAAIHRVVYALENRILSPRLFDESTKRRKTAGILYRLGKTVLVDNIVDHLLVLIQHEVFGHGARFREFGYRNISYDLSLFPPYGSSRGTAYGSRDPERRTTRHERIVISIGGSEANTILAESIRSRWLQRGGVKSREIMVYLPSSLDLTWYILRTRFGSRPRPGNDVANYLRDLNLLEGYSETDDRLTLEDLSAQTLVGLLNPTAFWAMYAYAVSYLYHGSAESELPMLRLRAVGYLPSFRLGLTPFGSVVTFENVIVHSGRVSNVFFRYGMPSFHRFGGFGVAVDNLAAARGITVSPRAEFWHQPSLLLGGERLRAGRSGLGGGVWARIDYQVGASGYKPRIGLEIGGKTDGFVEGEALGRGFTLRLGLSIVEH